MKNDHLIPVNIQDIVNRLNDKSIRDNERLTLLQRLETIRDYCAAAVAKNSRAPTLVQNRR
jgi:hypothetical protein